MYCKYCGKQVKDNFLYCPACGKALERQNKGDELALLVALARAGD